MKKRLLLILCWLLTTTLSFADGPFRNHRYDAFKVLPVNSEQIVFIGNSITNMHEWWEAFGNHNVVNRGVSGAVTDEALANIEAIAAGKPKKVFIMLGTNDLGTQGINTSEHVVGNLSLIVDRFKQTSPNTQVYIQSILPSTSGIRTLNALSAANTALQAMCTEKGITYIDLWSDMMGITSGNTLSYDNLHLTSAGYKIWCDKIAQYVNDTPGATSVYGTEAEVNGGLGGANGMRATVFSKLPVTSNDILIIGDEMVNGGEWHELLKSSRIKNRGTAWGYPGPSLADMLKMVNAIFNGGKKPAQVFLYAGVSDVNGSTALETVLANYKNVVAKIKELSPDTKITIMSLQPRSNASANNDRVAPFNTLLQQYAAESTADNIEFLDIYTDFVSGSVANTAYFTGDYLYGKGYVKVAQKIATAINEQGITAITDEEANSIYTRFGNRTALGNAIVTIAALPEGDGVGEYTTANLAGIKSKIAEAYAALTASTTASDVFTDKVTALTNATNTLLPLINQPATSDSGTPQWYQLFTPNRNNRYLASMGAGQGVIGMEANSYARTMWKFVTRTDGKFDIINRADGSYLAPTAAYNSQITTSTEQPQNGWELSYANSPGLFIVHSGTVQLNQTQTAKVYNWSAGQSGTDRGDTGCQYKISLYTGEPKIEPVVPTDDNFSNVITDLASLADGWYKIRVVTGSDQPMQGYITNGNNNVLNANSAYRQNASNFYPLKIGAYNTTKPTTGWVKIKKINNKYLIQTISGFGVMEPCTATRDISQSYTTISMSYGGFATIDKWSYYNPGANTEQPYIGKASSSNHKYAFAPVSASELAAYDIYTVSITGAENAAEIGNDPSVTYNGTAAIGGISKVYNNGYFFFPAGTTPVATDFTVPDGLKMTVDASSKRLVVAVPNTLEPIVTIDGLTFASYPYEVSKKDAAQIIGTTDVTIAMEVTMPASFNGRRAFISAGDPTQPTATSAVKDNSPYFAYGHYGANVAYFASSLTSDRFTTRTAALTANTVSKVVIVVDQTNNTYKVYVDGALHQEQAFPAGGYVLQTFNKLANNQNAKIYIGGGVTSNGGDIEAFQGKIHTVQFFDKALNTEEIASIEYPASKYYFAANTKQSDGSYIDRYLYVNGTTLANATGYELDNPNYVWSLILNGHDAYYLKNGSGKYLSYSPTSIKVADEPYSFQLKNEAVHTGVGALSLYNPTSSGGKYMVIAASGSGYNQNGVIVNNGSWCSDYILTPVTSVSAGYPAITAAINDAENLLRKTTEGTAPGCFTTESRTALQAAIDAASAKNDTEGLTDQEVEAATTAITTAINNYKAARCAVQYSTSENSVWYYIVSASTKAYCTEKAIKRATSGALKFDTKRLDPNMVWCFEKDANGKVAIRNYAGGYMSKIQDKSNAAAGMVETAQHNYTITAWDGESLGGNAFTIKSDASNNPLHAQESGSVIVTWAAENNGASLWAFVPLTNEETSSTAQLSSTAVRLGLTSTGIGNEKQPLLRMNFAISGLNGSTIFEGVKGNLTNSSAIANLYIYSVADGYEYYNGKSDAVLLGAGTPMQDGSFDITFNEAQTLLAGNSPYYWLVADISDEATEGTLIDAAITSYTVNGASVMESAGNPDHETTVFLTASTVEYLNTHGSRYYRIPAIATAMNGWLVAVTDKRWGSNGDLPNNIDVVARVSKDNGKTWTEPVTIAGTAELGGDYGHGDPAIITDRVTGDIFVLVTSKVGFFSGTPENPARLKYIVSHDNGLTWDVPVDITDDIYGAGCSDETRKTWHSMFFSSGAALQTSKGTLMCVAPVRTTSNTTHSLFQAHIIRSDDHGKTWTCNAVPALTDADESKIVELNDGTLLVKSRNQNKGNVYYATSNDDGKTWSERKQFDIKDSACNGDVIRLTSESKNEGANRLLLSIPFANDRRNVSVFLSTDEANSWPVRKTVCPGGSAYSTMCVLDDGTIGIYFEEDGLEGGYQMRYARFSLDWLTDGADHIDSDLFNAARVKEAQALATKLPEIATAVNEGTNDVAVGEYAAMYNTTSAIENALATAATDNNLQTIQEALTAYMATYSTALVLPRDGKVYRLKNIINNTGNEAHKVHYIANVNKGIAFPTTADNTTLWVCQQAVDGDNRTFVSASGNGYLAWKGFSTTTAQTYEVKAGASPGSLALYSGSSYLAVTNEAWSNRGVAEFNQSSVATQQSNWSTDFIFEEVSEEEYAGFAASIHAGSNGNYGTLNLPFAVYMPDGVTAEGVTTNMEDEKNELVEQPITLENNILPAGTPVLLTAEEAGSYKFAPAPAKGTSPIATGFRGTIDATAVTESGAYILAFTNGAGSVIRFFRLDANDNVVNANKAYFVYNGQSQATSLSLVWNGTTGIDGVEADKVANSEIYDLAGRKIKKITTPGIYIINGKKVTLGK